VCVGEGTQSLRASQVLAFLARWAQVRRHEKRELIHLDIPASIQSSFFIDFVLDRRSDQTCARVQSHRPVGRPLRGPLKLFLAVALEILVDLAPKTLNIWDRLFWNNGCAEIRVIRVAVHALRPVGNLRIN